jgi:hypothetical protein
VYHLYDSIAIATAPCIFVKPFPYRL